MRVNRNTKSADPEVRHNAGSCCGLVAYLEKENKQKIEGDKDEQLELWFTSKQSNIKPDEVTKSIDSNRQKLEKKASKFFEVHIDPSEKELDHMLLIANGKEEKFKEQLKCYVGEIVMNYYAKGFGKRGMEGKEREIRLEDLLWFGKLEQNRYYTHHDPSVKEGIRKRGEIKPGLNWHCHVIVSAKTTDGKNRISPFSNDRTNGKGKIKNGTISKGFSTIDWKRRSEEGFDQFYQYDRKIGERLDYMLAVRRGDLNKLEELEKDYKGGKDIEIDQKLADFREEFFAFQKLFYMNEKLNSSKKYSVLSANGFVFQEENGDLVVSRKEESATSIVIPHMNLNEFLGRDKEETKALFIYWEYDRKLTDQELFFIKEMAKPEEERNYEKVDENKLASSFTDLYLDDKKQGFLKQIKIHREVDELVKKASSEHMNTLEKVNFLFEHGIIVKPIYSKKGYISSFKAGRYNEQGQHFSNVSKLFSMELEVGGYGWKDYKKMNDQLVHRLYPVLVDISRACFSADQDRVKKAIDLVDQLDRPLHSRLVDIWRDGEENKVPLRLLGTRLSAAILDSYRTLSIDPFSGKNFGYERKASSLEDRIEQIEKRFEKMIASVFADYTDFEGEDEEKQAIKRRRRKDKEKRTTRGRDLSY